MPVSSNLTKEISVSRTRTTMSKSSKVKAAPDKHRKHAYRKNLKLLQIELVKLQRHFIKYEDKILVILEGRDAAGKDGAIKRIVRHLSPRETRVVALGAPSDREKASWYFQRYVPHLPAAQEFVIFNRSWYNRAGVEQVMGFCTKAEHEEFLLSVPEFEQMLIRSGIKLLKYYLDIDKHEQKKRLADRRRDPLKQWKISAIDDLALKNWKQYSAARNEMLARTHSSSSPWKIVRANDKHAARLNIIRDILTRAEYKNKNKKIILPDPEIIICYEPSLAKSGKLAEILWP
jgi:polyphosphate kinase 2